MPPPMTSKQNSSPISSESFRSFFRLFWIILTQDRFSLGSYLVMIALSCLYEYLATLVGTSLPQFYKVLLAKDSSGFHQLIWKCIGLFFGISLVKAVSHMVSGLFSLFVRQRLSERLQTTYVSKEHLYLLSNAETLDHPDQRITQDVERYATDIGKLIESVIIAPGLLIYYTYQVTQFGGFWAPIAIYLYFIVSYFVSQGLLRPIVPLIYNRERLEGDFRFLHVRLRTFAEPIALLQGFIWERTALNYWLGQIVQVQRRVLVYELYLRFWSVFVSYFGSAISYIGIGIPIFNGAYDNISSEDLATLISQNLFYSLYLINILTNISDLSDKMMGLLGYAARITQLLDAVERNVDDNNEDTAAIYHPSPKDAEITKETSQWTQSSSTSLSSSATETKLNLSMNPLLILSNISVNSPSGARLIQNLDVMIYPGDSLLVKGPSGSGKTSLVRVLAGLWNVSQSDYSPSGTPLTPLILRSFNNDLSEQNEVFHSKAVFLSQTPYLACCEPPYPISQQVVYPLPLIRTTEELERVRAALSAVELDYLLDRYESDNGFSPNYSKSSAGHHEPISHWDLSLTLSGGEQQRLCLARLFYHVPRLAVLDEVVSHLPIDQGNRILSRLRKMYPEITVIAFSHLPLDGFDKTLTLLGNERGEWRINS